MKAIRVHSFGGPEVLELEEVDDPVPAGDEVVIDVRAAGVNPTDTYRRAGTGAAAPELPFVPGGEAAGIVSAVGADVADFKIGDRAFIQVAVSAGMLGCYAEKVARKASEVRLLPDDVSFAAASALGISYGTAHYALFAGGNARAGETVFVHGASGSVGTAAVQLAKRAGLTVIGSSSTVEGRELVLREGADHAVNHGSDGYIDEVKQLTGGKGPDLILEMMANLNLTADMDLAARFGRIVVIGNRGEIPINAHALMIKDLTLRGIGLFNATPGEITAMMDDILAGVQDESLRPIIGHEFPLAEAAAAHAMIEQSGAAGKIVLLP